MCKVKIFKRLFVVLPLQLMLTTSLLAANKTASRPAGLIRPFLCNGIYASHSCTLRLELNHCTQSIEFAWPPLRLPGDPSFAKAHRTYCNVYWDGDKGKDRRKFPPQKCESIVMAAALGLNSLPEIAWQDAKCTLMGGSKDAIFILSQSWPKPKDGVFQHMRVDDKPDPNPVSVRIKEAAECRLVVEKKKKQLYCPVLEQRTFDWLKKFLATVGVGIRIQNKLQ